MRRLVFGLAALALLVLVAEVVSAQNAPVNGFCEQGGNNIQGTGLAVPQKMQQSYPTCTVTVFNFGGVVLSSIFSDAIGTVKANPFTADGFGRWQFYVPNGDYIVQISGGGLSAPFTLYSDVKVTGATAGIGGSGTIGTLPVFTAGSSIGNSIASQVTSGKNAEVIAGGGGFPGEIDLGNVNNANVVGFKSPANPAGSYVPTFPAADAVGCVQSNGAGVWSISTCPGATTGVTSANPITANQLVIGQDGVRGVQQLGSAGTSVQTLHGGSPPTFAAVALTTDVSGLLPGANGGTGVANTGLTITIGGNVVTGGAVTFSGAFSTTITTTGNTTNATLPNAADTVVELTQTQTLTNKTLTSSTNKLGGVTVSFGGDATGDMYYDNAGVLTRVAIGTPGQFLGVSGTTPTWSTPSGTGTVNAGTTSQMAYYASAAAAVSPLTWFLSNNTTQAVTVTGLAQPGGATLWSLAPGASTAITANIPDVLYTGPSVTVSAALIAEYDFWDLKAPVIAGSVAARVVTLPATFTVENAPQPTGGNIALTTPYAVYVKDGGLQFGPNTGTNGGATENDLFQWIPYTTSGAGLMVMRATISDGNARAAGFVINGDYSQTLSGGSISRFPALFSTNSGTSGTHIPSTAKGIFSGYEGQMFTDQPTANVSEEPHIIGLSMTGTSTAGYRNMAMTNTMSGASHAQNIAASINMQHASDGISYNFLAFALAASTNNVDAAYAIAPSPNNKYVHGVEFNGQDADLLSKINWGTTAGVATGWSLAGSTANQGLQLVSGTPTVAAEVNDFNYNARTLTISGAIVTERFVLLNAPTVNGAFTVTTAATLDIVGAPIPGTSTLTNTYALQVESGTSNFLGQLNITVTRASAPGGASANVNSTLNVNAANAGNTDVGASFIMTLTTNSATAELAMRGVTSNMTQANIGGGVVTKMSQFVALASTAAGGVTTTLTGFDAQLGTSSLGTVTTGIAFQVTSIQGTAKYGYRDDSGSQMGLGSTTFGSLPSGGNTQAGAIVYCSDCKSVGADSASAGAACVGAGTGAIAIRENATWRCY